MCASTSRPRSIPAIPTSRRTPNVSSRLLLDLLQAEKFSDRVMVQSFDWRTLLLVQQRAPAIPTVYLTLQKGMAPTVFTDKASEWTAGFNPADHGGSIPRAIKAAGGAIWSPYFGDVDPALISESHGLGLKVVVWTVNKPDDIARMIDVRRRRHHLGSSRPPAPDRRRKRHRAAEGFCGDAVGRR